MKRNSAGFSQFSGMMPACPLLVSSKGSKFEVGSGGDAKSGMDGRRLGQYATLVLGGVMSMNVGQSVVDETGCGTRRATILHRHGAIVIIEACRLS